MALFPPGFPGLPGSQGPGLPGPGFGPGQGPGQPPGAPTAPPPQFIPQQPAASALAVDPRAISGCLFRYTYIWPRFGPGFWFYPTFVGRTSVAGFRWTGFFWVFSGLDLRQISSFSCF